MTPPLDDLLDRLHVVSLPMRVRFRGITVREIALIDGPAGWGEFGAFLEYEPAEAAHWLAAGIEAAYQPTPQVYRDRIPINATVPAVAADEVPDLLARFPGARTAKVKVAASPTLKAVAAITDNNAAVEELYLSFLARRPSTYETEQALAHFSRTPNRNRNTALEDIAWALINKAEFLFSY